MTRPPAGSRERGRGCSGIRRPLPNSSFQAREGCLGEESHPDVVGSRTMARRVLAHVLSVTGVRLELFGPRRASSESLPDVCRAGKKETTLMLEIRIWEQLQFFDAKSLCSHNACRKMS